MEHVNFRPWIGKNYLSNGFCGKECSYEIIQFVLFVNEKRKWKNIN